MIRHTRKVGCLSTTLLVLSLFATLHAQSPQWWANRGVIVAAPANDYAAVTQGQLKQIAKLAMDEFNASMPGGAGTAIQQMVSGWSVTSGQATDFAGATVGHVKRVAAPFYDRLGEPYPWTATTGDDADLAIATIGQVKHAFSFEINGSGLDQIVTTAEDVPRSLYLGQGALTGTISYQVTVSPTNGQLLGTPPNVTYQPYAHYSGSDAFTFQASNGTQTATGHVLITVTPFDDPPLVDAGDLAQATVGVPLSISGTVTDIDTPPSAITTLWTRLSGPGTAVFGDDEALSTTVVFNTPGDHYLELVANGGGAPRGDTLLVKVQSAGSPAGPGVSLSATPTVVNKPNSITLSASVTGTCTKVEFYEGSRLLATDLSPPYSYEWTSSKTGKFRLKAVAYNGTAFTRSAPVLATVRGQGLFGDSFIGPGNNGNPALGGNGGSNPGSPTPPGFDPTIDPETHDSDGDGLTDAEELRIGTRPETAHSDGDGVPDNEDAWPNSTALVAPRGGEGGYAVVNLSAAPFGIPGNATVLGMDDYGNVLYSTPNGIAPPSYFVLRLDTQQSVPVPFQPLSISSKGVIAGFQGSIGYHWAFMQGGNPTPDTNSQTDWTQTLASNGTVTVCRGRGPATNGRSRGLAFRLPAATYPDLDIFGGTSGNDLKSKASDFYGKVVNSRGVMGGYRAIDSEVAGTPDPEMILVGESGNQVFRSTTHRFVDLSDDVYPWAATALALGANDSGSSQYLFAQALGWVVTPIQAFDPLIGNYRLIANAKKVNARAELLTDEGVVRNGILRRFTDLTSAWVVTSVEDINNKGAILCSGTATSGGGVERLLLIPIEVAPDVLRVNSDFDEKKIDTSTGYAKPDNADDDLKAERGDKVGKIVIDDLYKGFWGVNPNTLPPEFYNGAMVTIKKKPETNDETGEPEEGTIRLYAVKNFGQANEQSFAIPISNGPAPTVSSANPVNLAATLYSASSTIPKGDGVIYYIEGVDPGPITMEFKYVKGNLTFTHEQKFEVYTKQSKRDWQEEIRQQILLETEGGPYGAVDMKSYSTLNSFLNNRRYIQSVYAYYEQLFRVRPTVFYWAGLAKLAGGPVYAALSDAEYGRTVAPGWIPGATTASNAVVNYLQLALMTGNKDIFDDLAWQFRAYHASGIWALRYVKDKNLDQPAQRPLDIVPWTKIYQGEAKSNSSLVKEGNYDLTRREQEHIVQFAWDMLGTVHPSINWTLSILAKSPLTGEPDFLTVVPGGDITAFSDRWDWIDGGSGTIWPTWTGYSDSGRMARVMTNLKFRAQEYSWFWWYDASTYPIHW